MTVKSSETKICGRAQMSPPYFVAAACPGALAFVYAWAYAGMPLAFAAGIIVTILYFVFLKKRRLRIVLDDESLLIERPIFGSKRLPLREISRAEYATSWARPRGIVLQSVSGWRGTLLPD